MIGGLIVYVAIPIQVYDETRSTLAVGLVGLAELGPLLVGSIYGGAIADVVERVRLVVRIELTVALVTAVLAVNAATGPNVAALYVLAAASTGIARPRAGRPAARALLPRYVPTAELAAANALNGDRDELRRRRRPGHRRRARRVPGRDRRLPRGRRPDRRRRGHLPAPAALAAAAQGGLRRPGVGADDRGGLPLRPHPARDPRRLPRRLDRDGLRHAARAVPGLRRRAREDQRARSACCTRCRTRVPSSPASRAAGRRTSAARAAG